MAIRCRWPPESRVPRSPSSVSYPWGSCVMNPCALAACAASTTWSVVAAALPVGDVRGDRVVEQHGVLAHHGHAAAGASCG